MNTLDKIRESFTLQAKNFESGAMNFSKKDYLAHTVNSLHLTGREKILDAASGTCANGRSIAPFAAHVTCLDATKAMLDVGKEASKKEGLSNMDFKIGIVEDMPFEDETFDVVISRLAFHHFAEMEKPFSEMTRVLKRGGTLAIIDMEAAAEELREKEDTLEILRDPSHVKNRSLSEFLALYKKYGFQMTNEEHTPIEVSLEAWLGLTKTKEESCRIIKSALETELQDGPKTGFAPFKKEGNLYFTQRWLLLGVKG
jgi:ubiquinone/menaquinone biosynthesis C-methylase UbiE